MSLADAIATAPHRRLTGRWWHQGPTRFPLTSCADPAVGAGRYHRRGDPGVWYAANQEQAAWTELFRHFTADGIDPFEVRRRVGRVSVDLDVLDLTSPSVRTHLGVTIDNLTGDDYAITQELATAARRAGFDAVLAPSAALPDRQTLAVFVSAMSKVEAERSEVRQPPPRVADLLPRVRHHQRMPYAVQRTLRAISDAGSGAIRRRRR